MAIEKTKIDKQKAPLSPKKTKRNKHKTECSINRKNGCGICGSLNIAEQGVRYCILCGEEAEYLVERYDFIFSQTSIPTCECSIHRHHKIWVRKCIDCGAVCSRFCPNGKYHNCWKSNIGNKKWCNTCSYRRS